MRGALEVQALTGKAGVERAAATSEVGEALPSIRKPSPLSFLCDPLICPLHRRLGADFQSDEDSTWGAPAF